MAIDITQEVRDIVGEYPNTAPIFETLGIEYCCGGNVSLENACRDHNLALDQVISALAPAIAEEPVFGDSKWAAAPLGQLADHIVERYHGYAKRELPRLAALAAKVHARHGYLHPELNQLHELVDTLGSEMSTHMLKEEQVLFPRLKSMENAAAGDCFASLKQPIQRMLEEHEDTGHLLRSIRFLTHDYKLPEDACMTYRAFYHGLSTFEADTHWHVHLENNVLFPRALELEKRGNSLHATPGR